MTKRDSCPPPSSGRCRAAALLGLVPVRLAQAHGADLVHHVVDAVRRFCHRYPEHLAGDRGAQPATVDVSQHALGIAVARISVAPAGTTAIVDRLLLGDGLGMEIGQPLQLAAAVALPAAAAEAGLAA